jgi:uncharacterized peroxidase-related enzyme
MADQPSTAGVRVPLIAEEAATGRTAELYALAKSATGLPFVPDLFRLVSTTPELLHVLITGYTGVFGQGALPRQTTELIAAWTSRLNQCGYCAGTHAWFFELFGGSHDLAQAVTSAKSPDELPVDDRERALLHLLTKVSTAAGSITDDEWNAVASLGWSTEEMLEAVFCAALFNFVTRLVEALGLGASAEHSRIATQPQPTTDLTTVR